MLEMPRRAMSSAVMLMTLAVGSPPFNREPVTRCASNSTGSSSSFSASSLSSASAFAPPPLFPSEDLCPAHHDRVRRGELVRKTGAAQQVRQGLIESVFALQSFDEDLGAVPFLQHDLHAGGSSQFHQCRTRLLRLDIQVEHLVGLGKNTGRRKRQHSR